MKLAEIAAFVTDPWIFVVPSIYVGIFILLGVRMNYLGSATAWGRGFSGAVFLYALATGLVVGPQPLSRAFESAESFKLTWPNIGDAFLLLGGILVVYVAFTRLVRHPKGQVVGWAMIAYYGGVAVHVGLYRGQPIRELFS